MKALSLWQPWASFVAIGVKPFETRDWKPPKWMIGKRIAIHAAKKRVDLSTLEWAWRMGIEGEPPLGAVVCTAMLAGAYLCGKAFERDGFCHSYIDGVDGSRSLPQPYILNDSLGDYSEGRWAWWLTDIVKLDPPIPAKGMQGLWEWTPTG